jgi:hypothetical protein
LIIFPHLEIKKYQQELVLFNFAEAVRFELTTQLPGFRFSRAVPSTTRATLPVVQSLLGVEYIDTLIFPVSFQVYFFLYSVFHNDSLDILILNYRNYCYSYFYLYDEYAISHIYCIHISHISCPSFQLIES